MPRLLAALLAALALVTASAQSISYTVQVVAVSDQETALALQRDLLLEAFPAYVVRTTTAQGDIYRVRVGSFANRGAALLFAEAMPELAGNPALPALAEGIPEGVMPLQPRLLFEAAGGPLEVLPWGDGLALRHQADAGLPATYLLLDGGEIASFSAWRAAPLEGGGAVRLRNLQLWPSTWREDPAEVRESQLRSRIGFLADEFGVEAAVIEGAVVTPDDGPPYLLAVERFDPQLPTQGTVVAVAASEGTPGGYGPDALVAGDAELPPPATPLYLATAESEPATDAFAGDGWVVGEDEAFFLLSAGEGGRSWRAGVGTPLWNDDRHLLSRSGERLLLYDFVAR